MQNIVPAFLRNELRHDHGYLVIGFPRLALDRIDELGQRLNDAAVWRIQRHQPDFRVEVFPFFFEYGIVLPLERDMHGNNLLGAERFGITE
ncbi:hypothetical protein D3C74_438680 [compost metagenome]